MGYNTPRKRSDGRLDINDNYNTEIDFAGSPDPRHRDMAPEATSKGHDRGEHSIVNPLDTNEAGQSLDAPKQMKIAAGRDTGGGSSY